MSSNDTVFDEDGDDHTSHGDRVSRLKTHNSRESEHERSRNLGREKDHDCYRGGNRDGSVRDDRRRGKFGDFERHGRNSRNGNYNRHRGYDGDRNRRNGNRSGTYSQVRFRNRCRSHSRSPSPLKSRRRSGFDMAPPVSLLPGVSMTVNDAGHLPSVPQTMPGVVQNTLQFGTTQFGILPLMPAQAMTQQATRHARRVYIGGLPPMANEQTIATFFSHVMTLIGGNAAGPGDAVVNVYINHEKKFAFVEMRTVEEASNAMALDGILFEGVAVRVRRPTDYNPSLAATLGPSQPSLHLNLAAVGLLPGTISGAEGPDRVFVGGLPYYFTESQIRELLESFGTLCGFDLVKDRDTGNSKGYGFCVYQEGKVPLYKKSEPIPEVNNEPVKVVVADSLEDMVTKSGKNVLLEFYAPWCGHCQKLAPILDEVAVSYESEADVVIAKIDATANDFPADTYDVKGFPTLYFRSASGNLVQYEGGDRTKQEIIDFIEKNRDKNVAAAQHEPAKEEKKEDKSEKDEL